MVTIYSHNYTTTNFIVFLRYFKFTNHKNYENKAFEKKFHQYHVQTHRHQQLFQHHLLCHHQFRPNQSSPSRSPSPVTALQGKILQCLPSILSTSKNSLISLGFKAPAMSCLLQNTNNVAPASFSYCRSFCNSALQSSSLSLSPLSTTQMSPSVCSK